MGLYDKHILPRVIDLAMRNGQLAPYRERVLARAEGRVLEIGVGSGPNLPFYPSRATEIIGLEPHLKLQAMAAGAGFRVLPGSAEAIPLDSASVDTVVTTWTLCSIPGVEAALLEMRRVLRPGGKLLFAEHGLAPDAGVQRWQHRLTPLWKCIAGGCHLDRDIPALIRTARFEIGEMDTGHMRGPRPMTFMYEGWAKPL
jgi:ubiquinone/menaquinone biosynthesis C-methylase UbiE